MKKIILCACFFALISFGASCAENAPKKVSVVTTIFPLYDFIRTVGGDRVDVRLLIAPGVEPHMYEPTPFDIAAINEADIFMYTSDGMEPWVSRLLPGIINQNLLIIDASAGLREDGRKVLDPHIWMSFTDDVKIVTDIADALIAVDGENSVEYWDRAVDYADQLRALDEHYQEGLSKCLQRTVFFAGHFAFKPLLDVYGFQGISPYAGTSPDAEPLPQAVGGMISKIRENGAKYVFYEELIDPRLARVVSEETGATLELLHAAHNVSSDDVAAGVTFVSIMEENLKKLREGLMCP